jgi:hypothetical protein
MRIKFSGTIAKLEPVIILFESPGTFSFDKTDYPDHNLFDIIAIGGGGGYGGTAHDNDPDNGWETYAFGGAGGGGGMHRVQGLTEFLDDTTTVVVGDAGADGTDSTDPDSTTDGANASESTFGTFVKASGGLGGHRAASLSEDENQLADGGSGGFGGRDDAGGGAAGGICVLVDDDLFAKGKAGRTGKVFVRADDVIGQGGGGGAGGAIALKDGDWTVRFPKASLHGGNGSYDTDELYFAPGTPRQRQTPLAAHKPYGAKPGKGGGARATILNKSMVTYGNSGQAGAVIIRLDAE